MVLFYVTSSNLLAMKVSTSTGWRDLDDEEVADSGFSGRSVASDTRSLSVSFTPGGQALEAAPSNFTGVFPELLLFYENEKNNITAATMTVKLGTGSSTHQWKDISHDLYSSLPQVDFISPFTSSLVALPPTDTLFGLRPQSTASNNSDTNSTTIVRAAFWDANKPNNLVLMDYTSGKFSLCRLNEKSFFSYQQ